VSIDSMQVYRGMDVGTAKPGLEERTRVPHHMIDIADPGESYSVARFQAEARGAIAAIEARGRRALLVGGTGLYLRAVVDDLCFPPEDLELRELIDARYPGPEGLADAFTDLERRDPAAAAKIEPNNRRRIVRALEVIQSTGRPFSSFGAGLDEPLERVVPVRIAGINVDRALAGDRIDARLQRMVAGGLVDEVRRLAAGRWSRTAKQAIGYKEVLEYLRGSIESLELALTVVETRTRRFVRRQEAWFRRDRRIEWFGDGTKTPPDAEAVMAWWNGS
jgi:tRNA dimethylallyltransferase